MNAPRALPPGSNDPGLLSTWIDLVRRRWPWGIGVFVVVLGSVAALVLLAHPVHRGEAKLRLAEPPPSGGVSPTAGFMSLWRPGGDPFANDMELLGSRTVAEGVVEAAGLNADVRAPRGWHRDSLFVAFETGRETERGTFRVEWTDEGRVAVARTAPTASTVGVFAPGEEAAFGGVTVAFLPWREGMPRQIDIATLPFAESVRLTRQRLSAERVRREANVLDLRFDHTDPAVAERAVWAWVERFGTLRAELLQWETSVTVDSLRTRSQGVLAQLRRAEDEMEAFQARSRLVAPDAQSEVFAERFGEALTRLAEARLEREAARSLLARVATATDPGTAWSEVAAHPRFVENQTVGSLVTRLTELEAHRKQLALRRTEENPEHRAVLEQIADLDRMLRALASGYETALGEQVERLEGQVSELEAELAGFPGDAVELGRLQRSVRLLTEIFVATEQRLRQEELREALTFANVQIVDPPALRDRPVSPRRKLGLAVGLLLASGFALLAMVVVERADAGVRRASQVRALVGAPVLAAVPWSRNGAGPLLPRQVSALLRHAEARTGGSPGLVLAPVDARLSPGEIAEWLTPEGVSGSAEGVWLAVDGGPGVIARFGVAPPLETYGAAAEAVAMDAPVALLAVQGRTRMRELQRAARLLEEAGGQVAGVIMVCPRTGRIEEVWR